MNVALVVIISLVIVIPVLSAGGVMMWQSYQATKRLEAATDKERSVSTADVNVVDVEVGENPRLREAVVESIRRKRASMEGVAASEMSSTASTSHSSRREKRRKKQSLSTYKQSSSRIDQLTKVQSDKLCAADAATREPSHEVELAAV